MFLLVFGSSLNINSIIAFAALFGVERFADEDGNEITEQLPLLFVQPTKLIYQCGKVTAVLVRENGNWLLKPKLKKNKK